MGVVLWWLTDNGFCLGAEIGKVLRILSAGSVLSTYFTRLTVDSLY